MRVAIGIGVGFQCQRGGAYYSLSAQAGAYAGPYSSGNYFAAPQGTGPDFAVNGTTIVVCWWTIATPGSGDRCLYGSCRAGRGWWLNVTTNGAMRMLLPGGTPTLFSLPSTYASRLGRNCIAITRTAGGAIRSSTNGDAVGLAHAGPTIIGLDATCDHLIGRVSSAISTYYATNQGVIYVAHIAAEATDEQLRAWSGQIHQDEAWTPHAGVSGHANLVSLAKTVTDYTGGASMIAGAGSAPYTFSKVGTVARVELEREQIWDVDAHEDWWRNNAYYVPLGSGDAAYHLRSPFAEVRFVTDAQQIALDAVKTWGYTVGAYDQATEQGLQLVAGDSTRSTGDLLLTAGSKSLEVWDGQQGKSSPNNLGTWVQRVRFPASASVTLSATTPTANKLVMIGDSITVGAGLTNPALESITCLMGRGNATFGGDVQHFAASGESLHQLCGTAEERTAFAALVAAECAGSANVTLINELGINDYNQNYSAAAYQTALEDFWDKLHAALPTAKCYQVTCFLYSTKEATPNTAGSVPPDFRTAQAAVQAARSAWLTNIDGFTMCSDPPDFLADHLHLTVAGSAKAEAAIRAAVTSGGGWY